VSTLTQPEHYWAGDGTLRVVCTGYCRTHYGSSLPTHVLVGYSVAEALEYLEEIHRAQEEEQ
jgi:hypothetical protein